VEAGGESSGRGVASVRAVAGCRAGNGIVVYVGRETESSDSAFDRGGIPAIHPVDRTTFCVARVAGVARAITFDTTKPEYRG